MNLDDLIIAIFCEMDDAMTQCLQQLPKARLRQRGSAPARLRAHLVRQRSFVHGSHRRLSGLGARPSHP